MHIESVLNMIRAERHAQDNKWGVQRHPFSIWLAILVEEIGEVSEAILNIDETSQDYSNLKLELVQVAAVAVAMIEHIEKIEEEDNHG